MKAKLIKFNDESWGIRYGWWPFYTFQDFGSRYFTWSKVSTHMKDCHTTEESARKFLNRVKVTNSYNVIE